MALSTFFGFAMELTPYHRFVLLVQFDQRVFWYQKKIQSVRDHLKDIDGECAVIQNEQAQLEARLYDLRKQRDGLELESKTVSYDISQKRKKMENTADIKTYTALELEIKILESRLAELEEVIFGIWQQIEDQEKAVADCAVTASEQLARCAERRVIVEKELQNLEFELKNIENQRSSYLVGVPIEWLDTYEAMREQYANPVVAMQDNACGGCGFPIPSGDRSAVFRHMLIPCQQCRRLIFDKRVLDEVALEEKIA